MSPLLIYWFHIPKYIKCTARLYTSGSGRSYNAVSFLNPKIRIAKVHDITLSSAIEGDDLSLFSNISDTERKVFSSVKSISLKHGLSLYRHNSHNSPYFAYTRDWSQTLGQLSCTIAVYMRNWKCYIVHSDGEHEMLRYNWSPWLVTGITTSRYGHPTTNLLYLAVSYTTPLTRHRNAL